MRLRYIVVVLLGVLGWGHGGEGLLAHAEAAPGAGGRIVAAGELVLRREPAGLGPSFPEEAEAGRLRRPSGRQRERRLWQRAQGLGKSSPRSPAARVAAQEGTTSAQGRG